MAYINDVVGTITKGDFSGECGEGCKYKIEIQGARFQGWGDEEYQTLFKKTAQDCVKTISKYTEQKFYWNI